MEAARAWHESDAYWETWAPFGFDSERMSLGGTEAEQAVELMGIEPGAAVLDLCCGVGRHTLELARRGFTVTGVDRSRRFLDTAAAGAKREGLSVEFVEADMRTFRRNNAFDAAINLWTSFGYFEDEADDVRVLGHLFASLKPGGMLLMELMGKEPLARIFQPRVWEEHDDVIRRMDNRPVEHWRFIESRWSFFAGAERRDFTFRIRCYSGVELSDLLARCGFGGIEVYGDLAGSPYDHNAKRLTITARRSTT